MLTALVIHKLAVAMWSSLSHASCAVAADAEGQSPRLFCATQSHKVESCSRDTTRVQQPMCIRLAASIPTAMVASIGCLSARLACHDQQPWLT